MMVNFLRHQYQLFPVACCLLLASPLSLPAAAQPAAKTPNFQVEPPSPETDYTLGAGDRIRVDIFQVPDFSREYLVLVDGTVGFPLVGTLKIQGLTLSQLNQLLSQRYAAFIKRPVVTVGLLAPRPLTIAVSGEVNSPGSYTIQVEQGQKFPSVTDVLQQAGGLTATADVSQVQVRRFFQGKPQILNLNLWELFYKGNQGQNITLRDGDSLLIPTKNEINPYDTFQLSDANFGIRAEQQINVVLVGEVSRPGAYQILPSQITNIAQTGGTSSTGGVRRWQPPTITQAIAQAGGIKPLADIRRVQLRRFTRTGEVRDIEVDLWKLLDGGEIGENLILQNGDTITIPTAQDLPPEEVALLSDASFAPTNIRVTVVGEVLRPGALDLPPNTTLNQAIAAAGGFNKQRADQSVVELVRLNPNGTVARKEVPIDLDKGISDQNNPSLRNKDVIVVNRSTIAATTDTLGVIFSPLGVITGTVRGFFPFFDGSLN